jgi:thioredoxin 1
MLLKSSVDCFEEALMSENDPIRIDDSQFEQAVLNAKGISLVDFWAPWCGPCIQMAPGLEAFTKANPGKIRVFKLDVDDNPKTAEKYEIRSIPTIIFFRDGEPVFRNPGAMSQSSLQSQLDQLLTEH